MIAAVFDLDRTLLPETTAERIFLRYLVRQRVLGVKSLASMLRYSWQHRFRDIAQRIRADRPYLTGLHDAELRLHGRRCAREEVLPRLSDSGLEAIERHREKGHILFMLSGSLPYVVEPLARHLGFGDVICSQMALRDQRLAGGLAGLHPYGEAKAKLMQERAVALGLDLSESWCYADHHTDEPLLRMFGNPVCVNPSERLRRFAERRNWCIERFS